MFINIFRKLGRIEWIRFGIRDRILRFFFNPDTYPSKKFEVNFFGMKYQGDLSIYLDWCTYFFGAYAIQELFLMRNAIKSADSVIVDIGANIGHHSLFAATIAKQVYSFEPFPTVYKSIYDKIAYNNINNIKLFTVGLGIKDEELNYAVPNDCNTGTGSFIESNKNETKKIQLPIKNGDNLFSKESINKIDFVKIDVEGFEYNVLKGLEKTFKKTRPIMFVEWSANERNLNDDLKTVLPDNYKIFQFCSERPYWVLFNKSEFVLKEEINKISDGNKVLIPFEKIDILRKHIIK